MVTFSTEFKDRLSFPSPGPCSHLVTIVTYANPRALQLLYYNHKGEREAHEDRLLSGRFIWLLTLFNLIIRWYNPSSVYTCSKCMHESVMFELCVAGQVAGPWVTNGARGYLCPD